MVVLTKGTSDFREGQVLFGEDGYLERGETPTVMNPNDRFALEAALRTQVRHGGRVSVMSMEPPGHKEVSQEIMETVYADGLHLASDREMTAADTWATAITFSGGVEMLDEPDMVFAGFKIVDRETGHTGSQTNWCLDMPLVTRIVSLDVDEEAGTPYAKRLIEGNIEEIETVEAKLSAFVAVDSEFELSYWTVGERLILKDLRKETRTRAGNYEEHLTVRDHANVSVDPDYIGLDSSPTIVSSVDPIPRALAEQEATMVGLDDAGAMQDVLTAMQSTVGDGNGNAVVTGGD